MLPPPGSRVVVAMSGGVDSSVAAALLVDHGCVCTGVTLRLVPDSPVKSLFEPCCGLEAVQEARQVCNMLGIPHETLHVVERFDWEIIAYFVDEYRRARTPNPCIRCNRLIKFGALYERADALGAPYIAMGHFARVERWGSRWALRRGAHSAKDQSYVLAALSQEQLARAVFPLGAMSKEEVREYAVRRGLSSASRDESQEICFVPDRDYTRFIESRGAAAAPGPILNTAGEQLGQHRGLIHYTVGQRRGLGVAAPRPYYVVRLDPAANALIVGHEEETFAAEFTTGPIEWGAIDPQITPFSCRVQLRSRHLAAPATVFPAVEGATVRLEEPQRAVTPGQWAVFYEDDVVLGSAPIDGFTSLASYEAPPFK